MSRNGKNNKGGRPKGQKNATTLERDRVLAGYKQRVMQSADRLLDYQMSLARGSTYLFKIEKELVIGPKGGKTYRSKKAELVTDVDEIRRYLDGSAANGDAHDPNDRSATYYFITAKDPDGSAINSMLDRGLGKVPQGVDMDITTDGEKLKYFNEGQIGRIASRVVNARKQVKC